MDFKKPCDQFMVSATRKWLAMCSEALADRLRQGRLRLFQTSPDRRRLRCGAPLRPKDARHQSPQQGDEEINMAKGGGVVEQAKRGLAPNRSLSVASAAIPPD
jgi:hypothetical protein